MRCGKLENGVAREYNDEVYCPSNVNCEHKNKSVVYHPKLRMSCSPCKSYGNISDTREKRSIDQK